MEFRFFHRESAIGSRVGEMWPPHARRSDRRLMVRYRSVDLSREQEHDWEFPSRVQRQPIPIPSKPSTLLTRSSAPLPTHREFTQMRDSLPGIGTFRGNSSTDLSV